MMGLPSPQFLFHPRNCHPSHGFRHLRKPECRLKHRIGIGRIMRRDHDHQAHVSGLAHPIICSPSTSGTPSSPWQPSQSKRECGRAGSDLEYHKVVAGRMRAGAVPRLFGGGVVPAASQYCVLGIQAEFDGSVNCLPDSTAIPQGAGNSTCIQNVINCGFSI